MVVWLICLRAVPSSQCNLRNRCLPMQDEKVQQLQNRQGLMQRLREALEKAKALEVGQSFNTPSLALLAQKTKSPTCIYSV